MSFDSYNDYGVQVPYALVIDTDSYAGNFERDMCSWITGFEGEFYPGGIEYIVMTAREQLGEKSSEIIDCLGAIYNEYGSCEVIITNSPGEQNGYHSVAILFEHKPSNDLLLLMAARARSFPDAQYENAMKKSYLDMNKFKKINIINVRFESYKTIVQKTEINL